MCRDSAAEIHGLMHQLLQCQSNADLVGERGRRRHQHDGVCGVLALDQCECGTSERYRQVQGAEGNMYAPGILSMLVIYHDTMLLTSDSVPT